MGGIARGCSYPSRRSTAACVCIGAALFLPFLPTGGDGDTSALAPLRGVVTRAPLLEDPLAVPAGRNQGASLAALHPRVAAQPPRAFVVGGLKYAGAAALELLPPTPGAPWCVLAPSVSPLVPIGVYLNSPDHFETFVAVISYLLLAGRYNISIWTPPKWSFSTMHKRGAVLLEFAASTTPSRLRVHDGRTAFDVLDLAAVIVISHTFARDANLVAMPFAHADEPLYPAFVANSTRPLVFMLHEAVLASTRILAYTDAPPQRINTRALALSFAAPARIGVPTFAQARQVHPPAPFLGFTPPRIRRFIAQGARQGGKRDYTSLAHALRHPSVRAYEGAFEVLIVGAHPPGDVFPLDGVPGVVSAPPGGGDSLSEGEFNALFRSAHFLLPLQDAEKSPTYFGARFSSSMGLAFAYRLLLIAHDDVARAYALPPALVLAYSHTRVDGDCDGRNATVPASASGHSRHETTAAKDVLEGASGSLLQALLAALRMDDAAFERARGAYARYHAALDNHNVAVLRDALEGPPLPERTPLARPLERDLSVACADTRTFLANVDFSESLFSLSTPDAAACCRACAAEAMCGAWVWLHGACYMKGVWAEASPRGADSGLVSGQWQQPLPAVTRAAPTWLPVVGQ